MSALSHSREAEAHRSTTRHENTLELATLQAQRDRLRDSTVVPAYQVRYDRKRPREESSEPAPRPAKRPRPRLIVKSRLDMLSHRLETHSPRYGDVLAWGNYRLKSQHVLQPFYTHSATSTLNLPASSYSSSAPLHEVYAMARRLSGAESDYKMSSESLLREMKAHYPETEIATLREMRKLLRALSFKFGYLHSNHYVQIGGRDDVVYHRTRFAPVCFALHNSSRIFFTAFDCSFFHQNAHRDLAWIPQDVQDSDLIPCHTGVGLRLNVAEFVTESGLLPHSDGPPLPSLPHFMLCRILRWHYLSCGLYADG